VERKLVPGQSMEVAGYTLAYRGLTQAQTPNATERRAVLELGGRADGTLRAGKNFYPVEQSTSNEVGIHTNWLRGEDLFVIADQIDPNGAVYFKVLVKPLVNLLWIAGFVFVLGSLITLWPDAREQRRLALRYAESGVRTA
jgi:cytochrome c-type biogenesis protein CcmF